MTLSAKSVFTFIKEYTLLTIGMFCYSFAWIGCVIPAGGTGGGATGFSLLLCTMLQNVFGIDIMIGTMAIIINAILLIIAGFLVGWKFGIKTIFSVIMISVGLNFWEWYLPTTSFNLDGLEDVLKVVLGGILAGIGVALGFMQGGSTGGTDIVAICINKFRTVSYGKILMVTDSIIIGSTLFLEGYGLSTVIYGYIMTVVVGYTVDMLQSGNQQSNQIMIMTRDYKKMAEALSANMGRGVTLLDSQGWYTKEQNKVVMIVCRKRETTPIMKFIRTVDPDAFITVNSVMGVYGKGFDALSKI